MASLLGRLARRKKNMKKQTKNQNPMFESIKAISEATGLPQFWATDLDLDRDALKVYDGKTFLFILRKCGTQLCLLEGREVPYYDWKLTEWNFYNNQDETACFYYYNGKRAASIAPSKAIKMITDVLEVAKVAEKKKKEREFLEGICC